MDVYIYLYVCVKTYNHRPRECAIDKALALHTPDLALIPVTICDPMSHVKGDL